MLPTRPRKPQDKAKAEGREIEDGEFTTACAQACPADAIIFGRLDDPDSRVNQLSEPGRGFQIPLGMRYMAAGALFFHADYIAEPWRLPRTRTVQIGRHIFYR